MHGGKDTFVMPLKSHNRSIIICYNLSFLLGCLPKPSWYALPVQSECATTSKAFGEKVFAQGRTSMKVIHINMVTFSFKVLGQLHYFVGTKRSVIFPGIILPCVQLKVPRVSRLRFRKHPSFYSPLVSYFGTTG